MEKKISIFATVTSLILIAFIILFPAMGQAKTNDSTEGFFRMGASYNSDGVESMALDFENEVRKDRLGLNFEFSLDKEQIDKKLQTFDVLTNIEVKYYYDKKIYAFLGLGYDDTFNIIGVKRTRSGLGAGCRGVMPSILAKWKVQDGFYLSTAYTGKWYDRSFVNILSGNFDVPLYENLNFCTNGRIEINMQNIDNADYRFRGEPAFNLSLAENITANIGIEYNHIHRPGLGEQRNRCKYAITVGTTW